MKIKLALLESDANYLGRIVPMFNNKYAGELEIYSFTDVVAAMNCLEEKKIDVFLASTAFKIDYAVIPKRCGFAYLVESLDIESFDHHKVICKFQKGELIYKQILSIYSEHVPSSIGISNSKNGDMKTIAFCSPCGGVGTSTTAAACAIFLAGAGHRVLYLNVQVYGDSDSFFSCDGQFDFSDVIYAVKSNKTNRAMKLQSTVKQDASGVYFYSSVKVPLDMMEMNEQDYLTLQSEFQALGCYDYLVLDLEMPKTQSGFKLLEHCNNVVLVSDGTNDAGTKLQKALRTIRILDGNAEFAIEPRLWMIENKTTGKGQVEEIRCLGSFPLYQSAAPAQIAKQLALSNIFVHLI